MCEGVLVVPPRLSGSSICAGPNGELPVGAAKSFCESHSCLRAGCFTGLRMRLFWMRWELGVC